MSAKINDSRLQVIVQLGGGMRSTEPFYSNLYFEQTEVHQYLTNGITEHFAYETLSILLAQCSSTEFHVVYLYFIYLKAKGPNGHLHCSEVHSCTYIKYNKTL